MDWWLQLLLIVLSLLALMFIRVPVAFAFFTVNIAGVILYWGGEKGLIQLVLSIEKSLANFALLPIPLFILMGEIMFYTGIAPRMIDSADKWIGKIPGRLSLLSVLGGTMISTLTGSTVSSTAMLGSTLTPEMEKKGYKKEFSLGPILGSGTLAAMIPPSSIGVLLASIGKISIGAFMIAIIIPGILMALSFAAYIVIRAKIQPHLAPNYNIEDIPLTQKIKSTVIYILPLGFVVFLVIGFMFLGIATPTEAAALGSVGSMILAAFYRQLTWPNMKKALAGTLKISAMMLLIVGGSSAFSQILSFSGATRELVAWVAGMDLTPTMIIIVMLGLVLIMGTFMESLSILMIVMPIFVPLANMVGIDLLWFAVMLLIIVEVGTVSPPFGTGLFVMKSVAPKGTTMKQVYASIIPFIIIDFALVAIILIFPELGTWLPTLMRN